MLRHLQFISATRTIHPPETTPPNAAPPPLRRRRLVRRQTGDIDDLPDRRIHRHDLHRPLHADQQRPDRRAAAQMLHQTRRDVRRVQPRHHQHVGIPGQPAERITARGSTAPARRRDSFRRRIRNPPCACPAPPPRRASGCTGRCADRRTSSATAAPPAVRAPAAARHARHRRRYRPVPRRRVGNASACRRRRSSRPRLPSSSVRPKAMSPGSGSIACPIRPGRPRPNASARSPSRRRRRSPPCRRRTRCDPG